jgi:hypothetical protein
MTKMSSTMLSGGTLLRHAQDTGTEVKVLVQGNWLDGRVLGCDGLGAILDGGESQFLVRLDQVTAVEFSKAHLDGDLDPTARPHTSGSGPIEAGPVTVPAPSRGEYHFLSAKPY